MRDHNKLKAFESSISKNPTVIPANRACEFAEGNEGIYF